MGLVSLDERRLNSEHLLFGYQSEDSKEEV